MGRVPNELVMYSLKEHGEKEDKILAELKNYYECKGTCLAMKYYGIGTSFELLITDGKKCIVNDQGNLYSKEIADDTNLWGEAAKATSSIYNDQYDAKDLGIGYIRKAVKDTGTSYVIGYKLETYRIDNNKYKTRDLSEVITEINREEEQLEF
ncbi:MAG: hypothetical protein N4A47_02395 [Clostridia bacterium]|jgi:hypothetical protein|nr:hypothetical protein [Clostridia bacterium]